jgi:serine protease inhibitor
MAMRKSRVLAAVVAMVAVHGCAAGPDVQSRPRSQGLPGVERVAAPVDAPVTQAVAGVRSFADAFGRVTQDGGNTVFSPLSVAAAFAMLRAAAAGETARQLDITFGFPASGVHTAFNALTRDVSTPSTGAQAEITIANGLFVREGLRPSTAFLRTLAEQYGAGAQAVDFTSPDAVKQVNAWVHDHTAGRIDGLFDKLAANTLAVLTNAVYLKAAWQVPFAPAATGDEPFHRANGSTVDAPMMHLAKPEPLAYVNTPAGQAVRLPYAGGEFAMWILVPDKATTAPRFDAATLADLGRAERKIVDLAVPRWDFATDVELLTALEQLGVTSLDDLPGISSGAFVSQAVHRATITVDEYGTEATAATGIVVGESAALGAEVTVRADHPFAFAITHEPTGAPVFLGTVADPTAYSG